MKFKEMEKHARQVYEKEEEGLGDQVKWGCLVLLKVLACRYDDVSFRLSTEADAIGEAGVAHPYSKGAYKWFSANPLRRGPRKGISELES